MLAKKFTIKGEGKIHSRRKKGSTKKKMNDYTSNPLQRKHDAHIKKVIARMAEHKRANFSASFSFGASTGTTFTTSNIQWLSPNSSYVNIVQGTGQGDRVGNKIRITNAKFSGVIYGNPYHATVNPLPQPQEVRMWFFAPKNSLAQPTSYSTFFQNGNSSQNFSGTLLDLTKKINNDDFTYYGHRTYKIGYSAFVGSPGSVVGSGYYSNNDFAMNRKFSIDITKMLPKNILWNDTTTTPFSRVLFVIFECVNADGSAQGAALLPCSCQYSIDYTFTDS